MEKYNIQIQVPHCSAEHWEVDDVGINQELKLLWYRIGDNYRYFSLNQIAWFSVDRPFQ